MKQVGKNVITFLIHSSGINSLYSLLKNKEYLRVINYHKIINTNPDFFQCDTLSVKNDIFEKQIKYILKKGYKFLSIHELEKIDNEGKHILLTFDDGSNSIYFNAFKILKKYKVPFTIFLTTDPIINEENNFWWEELDYYISNVTMHLEFEINNNKFCLDPENLSKNIKVYREIVSILRNFSNSERLKALQKIKILTKNGSKKLPKTILSASEIQEMINSGLCSIQCHSATHTSFQFLSEKEIEYEIKKSTDAILELTKVRPKAFAFPGGFVNKKTFNILKNFGYRYAFETYNGINKKYEILHPQKEVIILDRTSIGSNDNFYAFATKLSGLYTYIKPKNK